MPSATSFTGVPNKLFFSTGVLDPERSWFTFLSNCNAESSAIVSGLMPLSNLPVVLISDSILSGRAFELCLSMGVPSSSSSLASFTKLPPSSLSGSVTLPVLLPCAPDIDIPGICSCSDMSVSVSLFSPPSSSSSSNLAFGVPHKTGVNQSRTFDTSLFVRS